MRKETVQSIPVPAHIMSAYVTDYTCDKCGKPISRDDHGDGYAHELQVYLDPEECVNFVRQRDYCPECLRPIWEAINTLIDADPDDERDKDYS